MRKQKQLKQIYCEFTKKKCHLILSAAQSRGLFPINKRQIEPRVVRAKIYFAAVNCANRVQRIDRSSWRRGLHAQFYVSSIWSLWIGDEKGMDRKCLCDCVLRCVVCVSEHVVIPSSVSCVNEPTRAGQLLMYVCMPNALKNRQQASYFWSAKIKVRSLPSPCRSLTFILLRFFFFCLSVGFWSLFLLVLWCTLHCLCRRVYIVSFLSFKNTKQQQQQQQNGHRIKSIVPKTDVIYICNDDIYS